MVREKCLVSVFVGCLVVCLAAVPAQAGGVGFGPNYRNPPDGANSGSVWLQGNSVRVNWWNWYAGDRQLYYYAYQLTNQTFQPHVGSFLMAAPPQVLTYFEGDSYTLGIVPFTYWNQYTYINPDPPYELQWFGWAADQGQELPQARSTSGNPYFELTSPYAPGQGVFKISDYNFDQLMGMGGPDPFIIFSMPGPVPEPVTLSLLLGGGLAAVLRRRR